MQPGGRWSSVRGWGIGNLLIFSGEKEDNQSSGYATDQMRNGTGTDVDTTHA